jgi:photosystem II stability/assembly factor-like uncharacterized protein
MLTPVRGSAAPDHAPRSASRTGSHNDETPSPDPAFDRNDPVVPGFVPTSSAFWDADRGLIAGHVFRCHECWHDTTGAIAMTIDGGATWRVIYQSSASISDLDVGDGDMAWATRGEHHTRIIRTLDGGVTWHVMPPFRTARLSHPNFVAANDGWAIASTRLVRWDGAAWSVRTTPCPGGVRTISFPTGSEGWISCEAEGGAGNEPKEIHETMDAGATWVPRVRMRWDERREVGDGLFSYGYVADLAFTASGSGWLTESRGTFFVSDDGGSTWTDRPGFQEPEVAFGVDVSRTDDEVGAVTLSRPFGTVVLLTLDGGRSWRRIGPFTAAR